MKKILLVLSLLGLVLAETSTNAFFWGRSYTPSDYPNCCAPQTVNTGCRTRCCRNPIIGRGRWSCCRTLRCCKPKKVCCPRYKCCAPKPACCPTPVPACETTGCVTSSRTTCYEDYSNVPYDQAKYASSSATYMNGNTVCTEDTSSIASYPQEVV